MGDEPAVCEAARALLGAVIVGHDGVAARITEVEAYDGPNDPASHAFTRTPRSEIMYGPAMRLYVYRMHGHHCANVITSPEGQGSAVLLRAGEIVDGLDVARARRGDVPDHRLGRGPGNLAKALGITIADLGTDVTTPPGVVVRPPTASGSQVIAAGPRVGVRLAADRPWRFWVDGDPTVSAYRRHPGAS
ncbi:DNA-3-methyladenine glycosylase [Gordonia sp. (in: high G+C Gram-positive bacteria)]|uniref:DNA-3-methyladenine glycosylase n=1 Tax=Gordonia sp. (in: high G+C Gram-positive bacteria) TaxID=84139 RepID=UPI0039E4F53A